jgi:hypothetical protein
VIAAFVLTLLTYSHAIPAMQIDAASAIDTVFRA